MKIEIKVQNREDREKVVGILAENAYTVRVLQRKNTDLLFGFDYYIEVEIDRE